MLTQQLEEERMKAEDLEAELKNRCEEIEYELETRGRYVDNLFQIR